MKASYIRDELKHVRLIHFTLTTLSGVMFYFIIAAWSSVPPQLYTELLRLRVFLSRLHEGVQLGEIDAQAAITAEGQILQNLRKVIDAKLEWGGFESHRPPLTCAQWPVKAEEQKLPLIDRFDDAMNEPCRYMLPEIEDDVADIKAWIKEQLATVDHAGGPNLVGFLLGSDTKAGPGNAGSLILEMMHFKGSREGTIPLPVHEEFKVSVTLRPESCPLPRDWLKERFGSVSAFYDVLGTKSLDDALLWAQTQRTKEIESLKPAVLGVGVKSTHIGGVGPLVMGAMLLYLLAYLRHCLALMPEKATSIEESAEYLSPWLGAQDFLGSVIAAATIAVIPGFVTMLSLRRLLGWAMLWSSTFGLIALIIGVVVVISGHRLAGRKVEP